MARKLTFFVASKVDSIATARALLLQTPMVTTEFLGKLDPEKLEHNFDKNMPRMSDFVPDEQYMPDEKRRRLFENVRVIVKTESLHLSLSHVLEGLNAEIINYEDGMNLENAILVSSNPLDGFADLQMLIQAIKNVDLDYVQPRARPTRRRIMAEYTVQDTLDVMFGGEVADTKKVQVPSSQPVFDSNESVPASNDKGEADSEVLQQEEAVSSEKKVLTAQATSLKHKHNIAEAIRMTKQIRKESQQKDSQILTGPDSLEEPKISVTVEPAILIRPQKVSDGHQDRVSHNGNVKNFKRFRKTGKKCTGGQWDGSRVFLNLVEFNVNPNSISTKDKEFLEGFAESFNESIQDLDKQMQPQKSLHTKRRPQQAAVLIGKKPRSATPLFVEEDDDIETNSVAGISPGMSINDNDDDHTPKFRFSRG
ncbi:unnamed protein product [Kuraishia capsulata CBS 1993]|uniref:Nibrin second BRCT domain-containing protein n=1 Tax=Kuraishia capsulata CBS 1993 TaxID=1382522 RepID=W6MQM6_9ASCO|nr:uncharacterized protein KUCA_T00003540001 [Kuraishia capsulata CBS 1993]CDK27562.1 unnamed protein product [Kuraishia capsulata CBS 1993]